MSQHTFNDFLADPSELNGGSALVTGATGSFGRRFVQTVLERFKPRRLIVFSRDELKQSEMAETLSINRYPPPALFSRRCPRP